MQAPVVKQWINIHRHGNPDLSQEQMQIHLQLRCSMLTLTLHAGSYILWNMVTADLKQVQASAISAACKPHIHEARSLSNITAVELK